MRYVAMQTHDLATGSVIVISMTSLTEIYGVLWSTRSRVLAL